MPLPGICAKPAGNGGVLKISSSCPARKGKAGTANCIFHKYNIRHYQPRLRGGHDRILINPPGPVRLHYGC